MNTFALWIGWWFCIACGLIVCLALTLFVAHLADKVMTRIAKEYVVFDEVLRAFRRRDAEKRKRAQS